MNIEVDFVITNAVWTPATPDEQMTYDNHLDKLHGGTARASLIKDPAEKAREISRLRALRRLNKSKARNKQ